jgi:hypothetical protein
LLFLKKFVNSTIGTAEMKPLDQLIASGSAPILNVVTPTAPFLANSQVFTTSGTFTAPKTGVFYVTLLGHGGAGGAGGNFYSYGVGQGQGNHGGYGGNGGSGYVKLRVPVAMTAGQQTAATIGANTTFGSMTVANGTAGYTGGGAYSAQGGNGGTGGRGAVPGDGGYGGSGGILGGTRDPSGAPGAAGLSPAQPFPFIVSSDGRDVTSVFGLPDLLATYIFNGGSGGQGGTGTVIGDDDYYAPKPGSAGKNGVVIIEWD